MRAALVAAAVLGSLAGGCKKKAKDPPAIAPGSDAAVAPTKPPLPPLPPATSGPIYVSLMSGGYLRLDGEGWKQFSGPVGDWRSSYQRLVLGADGTLWGLSNKLVWRWNGDTATSVETPLEVLSAAGATDGSLWAVTKEQLQHLVDGAWVVEQLPGGDPARGVAAGSDGVWIHTIDRTYRRGANGWQAFDVPGVTGQQIDILSIASNGVDQTYLATSEGMFVFDGKAWQPFGKLGLGSWAAIFAGPGGRFALSSGDGTRFVGDTSRGVVQLEVEDLSRNPSEVIIAGIDARGRTYAFYDRVIKVFDENGKVLKRWTSTDLPLLTNQIGSIVIGAGGPTHLEAGERAAGTVNGKLEGSAAGMQVITCAEQAVPYGKDPCSGIPTARTATTSAGGRFTLTGVTIGPTYFWAKRKDRWRSVGGPPCCAQLTPDGTVELGTLSFND